MSKRLELATPLARICTGSGTGLFAATESAADEMADLEKFDTLRLPFFADFSDVEIWEVVRFSQWSRVSPGTRDHSRRRPRGFLLLPRRRRTEGAQERPDPDMLTTGECFGEMAVIGKSNCTRVAPMSSPDRSQAGAVTGSALQDSSEACRMHFYQSFLAVLSARLTSANVRLVSF
jgi:hypothetical protein